MCSQTLKPSVRAVIFDLGRVLVNMDSGPLKEKLFQNFKADDIEKPERQFLKNPIMVSLNCGRLSPVDFHRQVCDACRLDMNLQTFKALWCDIFWTMDGMEELVGEVCKKVPVGLLSDTDPVHWEYIRTRWPWIGSIANPTLSYEVGVMKPSPAIYLAAAGHVQTPPEQCLFIDDLQANVDGARAVGMQGIRFESVEHLKQEIKKYLNGSA
ncbi:MAG: HAD family phosphatase [Planctomycetota bacterium]